MNIYHGSLETVKTPKIVPRKNGLTATQAADTCGVNRNTANRYDNLLRRAVFSESIREVGESAHGKSHNNGMRTHQQNVDKGASPRGDWLSSPLRLRQICAALERVRVATPCPPFRSQKSGLGHISKHCILIKLYIHFTIADRW